MSKSIYLCGFMGCGKSRIGRVIARKMNRRFADLDAYIVRAENRTIAEIFEQDGEPYFRDLEAKYIQELSGEYVIATGGGAILRKQTADFAAEKGVVFFLDTDFEICYERIKNDPKRPLVVKNTKERLRDMYNYRKDIYRANSAYTVEADGIDTDIAEEIIRLFHIHNRQSRN